MNKTSQKSRKFIYNMSRNLYEFFQRKVDETNSDESNVDFESHSNEKSTNQVIDHTSSSQISVNQVSYDSHPFHPPSTFTFPKTKSGTRERSC